MSNCVFFHKALDFNIKQFVLLLQALYLFICYRYFINFFYKILYLKLLFIQLQKGIMTLFLYNLFILFCRKKLSLGDIHKNIHYLFKF